MSTAPAAPPATLPLPAPYRAEPGFLAALEDLLVERWSSWELPGRPERPFQFLLVGNYEARNKVVLCFPRGAHAPAVVAKVTRGTGATAGRLRHEHAVLRELRPLLPPAIAGTVPRALYYGLCWGNVTAVFSALPGAVLWNRVSRDFTLGSGARVRGALVRTASWILPFHQATMAPRSPASLAALSAPLANVRRVHAFSPLALDLLDAVAEELAALSPRDLPRVCEHGDFWMGNALATRDGLGMADWEEASLDGLPFVDLFLLIHTTAVLRRNQAMRITRMLEAYAESHFEATWVSDVARQVLAEYAAVLGLTRESAQPLFPLLLARLATREHDTIGASGTLDRFWRDSIEIFAERRSQFLWLADIPRRPGAAGPDEEE